MAANSNISRPRLPKMAFKAGIISSGVATLSSVHSSSKLSIVIVSPPIVISIPPSKANSKPSSWSSVRDLVKHSNRYLLHRRHCHYHLLHHLLHCCYCLYIQI